MPGKGSEFDERIKGLDPLEAMREGVMPRIRDDALPAMTDQWWASSAMTLSLDSILKKAGMLEGIENQRFAGSMDLLKREFDLSNKGFAEDNSRLDRLLFAGSADKFGREAAQGIGRLRSSLGARGLNPGSGTAAALAGQVALRQSSQMAGARRDITADSLRRRDAQRQNRFKQAFGIAEFGNQSPSMLGLDAMQDVTGVIGDVRQDHRGADIAAKNRSTATKNAWIGAAGGLLGGLL